MFTYMQTYIRPQQTCTHIDRQTLIRTHINIHILSTCSFPHSLFLFGQTCTWHVITQHVKCVSSCELVHRRRICPHQWSIVVPAGSSNNKAADNLNIGIPRTRESQKNVFSFIYYYLQGGAGSQRGGRMTQGARIKQVRWLVWSNKN